MGKVDWKGVVKMLSVLLVDDERWVRTGIRQKICWGEQFAYCGEAADGIEAYHIALNLQPDIIITDVRMPGMDGLTMVKKLQELLPETAVIVISGYHEFEYVKSALDLGAVSYALKPVSQEELGVAMEKARKKILQQQTTGQSESYASMAGKALSDLFYELPVNRGRFEESLFRLGSGQHRYFGCFLIQVIQYEEDYDSVRHSVAESLALVAEDSRCLLFEPTHTLFGVLVTGQIALSLEGIAKRMMQRLRRKHHIDSSMVLGDIIEDMSLISNSIACAKRGLPLLHPYARNEIILPGSSPFSSEIAFPVSVEEALVHAIYASDRVGLVDAVEGAGRYFVEHSLTLGDMKSILVIILGDILRIAYQGDVPVEILNEGISLVQKTNQMNQWDDLQPAFTGFCKKVSACLAQNVDHVIDRALGYLQTHYAESLSLSNLAQTFHLSPSYFSSTFKQHTGKTFSDYLTALRMDKAKELLVGGSLKVVQVAKMVGYDDHSYFGKLFRKHVGLMPSAYQSGEARPS